MPDNLFYIILSPISSKKLKQICDIKITNNEFWFIFLPTVDKKSANNEGCLYWIGGTSFEDAHRFSRLNEWNISLQEVSLEVCVWMSVC